MATVIVTPSTPAHQVVAETSVHLPGRVLADSLARKDS